MNQGQSHDDAAEPILVDGTEYRGDFYEETTQTVGSQREVAQWWVRGKLPTKRDKGNYCRLVSGTRNFTGRQYPDGHGKLIHYSTLEAIRTRTLLTISNTECYAKGFAECTTPTKNACPGNRKESLPLTTIRKQIQRDQPFYVYDITDVLLGDKDVHKRLTDDDGYDRLVIFTDSTGDEHAFRASYDAFDSDELTDNEVGAFLAEVSL